MKRFCVRALPVGELTVIAKHLAGCPTCHGQFTQTLQSRIGSAPLKFILAPEFWFRHEHVDYEQLVRHADSTLDASEREILDIHLKVCAPCKEDIRSFLEFRKQMAQETETSFAPVTPAPERDKLFWTTWWRGLAWKPIYAAVLAVVVITLVIGAAFILKRRADFQARQTPPPQVSPGTNIDNRTANVPSPPATPNESPADKPTNAEAVVVLNDRGGTITVDKNGDVVGLDNVPAPTRDEIAQMLLSEKLDRPAILNELGGQGGGLRGSNSAQPFKLTYPSRTVIVTDRPNLKWEKAPGASSYRVYVSDQAGHEIARSEDLLSERTQWKLPKPLKRGEIYVWTVVALVDGKEIVSPGPSSPEMKFQVLSRSSLGQLNKLKKAGSHLALGVFYAKNGLLAEASQEFFLLVKLNPKSPVATNLLRSVSAKRF